MKQKTKTIVDDTDADMDEFDEICLLLMNVCVVNLP